MMWLVIQRNSDGRTCAWAVGFNLDKVKEAVERIWSKHECYPGERKGNLETMCREPGDSKWSLKHVRAA